MTTTRILEVIPTQQRSDYRSINLSQHDLEDGFDLRATLQSLNGVKEANIDLSYNRLGVRTAKTLAFWLESGWAPKNVTLNLNANDLDDEASKLLADASSAPDAPSELKIYLGTNKLSDAAAKHWAEVIIAKPVYNKNIKLLSLASNFITEAGAKEIENAKLGEGLSLIGNNLDVTKRYDGGKSDSVENFRHSAFSCRT